MRDKCIDAVVRAAGRALTQQELTDIENRIVRNQRALAVRDRQAYLAMSPNERIIEAGKLAAQEFAEEAAKKKQRIALTIQAHDRVETYMKAQEVRGIDSMESLRRLLAFNADNKSRIQSVETRGEAIAKDYIRTLVDTFESIQPKIFGLFNNAEGERAISYELYGEDSRAVATPEVAALAKQAAKVWAETTESARQSFNAAGGKIGKLEDWGRPQSHSQYLTAKAGKDAWVKDHMAWVDRSRYVDEHGAPFGDQRLFEFLSEAWTTIATGGANKGEPGKPKGAGMLANQNAEQRQIHYKDANAFLLQQKKYGGSDAYSSMMNHIMGLSKDMAMVDVMGPNPDLTFKYFMDKAVKEMSIAAPTKSGDIQKQSTSLQNLYDYISGNTKPVANQRLAQTFDTLRNWMVATRLGSAWVTSITDNATMQLTAAVNNMSHMQLMRNQLSTMNLANKTEKRMAQRAALSLNTLIGQVNRHGVESMGPSFSAKMSSLTIRVQGLNAATEARRRAFGVTMYGSIGGTVKDTKAWAKISPDDLRLLESKGVTEADFNVWKTATLEDWGNGNDTMLTPEAVYAIPDKALAGMGDPKTLRREAALKLIGMVDEEVNMAVIEPGASERSFIAGNYQRGTWKGEIMRSFFLFKTFPIAMITRHLGRGMGMETAGGKAAYIAGLVASTTLLGAMAAQMNEILSGRDPKNMDPSEKNGALFWVQAMLKGGSLGIYGDFVFNTNTQYGNSPIGSLAGPVVGLAEDLLDLTQGSLVRAAKGERTDFGPKAVRMLKNSIPLQNLWYTKAVIDRLIFSRLQEEVSPGYQRRMEQRARRDFKQEYYWKPGSVTPERAPNLERALGEK